MKITFFSLTRKHGTVITSIFSESCAVFLSHASEGKIVEGSDLGRRLSAQRPSAVTSPSMQRLRGTGQTSPPPEMLKKIDLTDVTLGVTEYRRCSCCCNIAPRYNLKTARSFPVFRICWWENWPLCCGMLYLRRSCHRVT